MTDVLIIANKRDYSYSLLPYFLKYKIKEEEGRITEPFYTGNVDKSILTGVFSFVYNGINITIKFVENTSINELLYDMPTKYDKIFILEAYDSREATTVIGANVEILYFKIDENFHQSDECVKDVLSKFRIISSASLSFEHSNFYHEPILNLYTFYYCIGFNYLSYNKLNVSKQNLIGMYYSPKYKMVRDDMHYEISNIFQNRKIEGPTVYNTNSDKPHLISKYLENNNNYWGRNHSSMYSDYITSVCGFVFDTLNHRSIDGPAEAIGRSYINEKALKAILFSKLNIPFIIDTNPYNFNILNDLGFWFLNSEFHTFSKNKTTSEMVLETKNSIISSIEYLIGLYEKNNFDLDKTHNELVSLYGHKMQNNYFTFMKYLEEPKDGDNLINFILYGNRT
jgi:hypothetical protein